MCGDLASLCQHLKDRHRGVNSASAPGSVNAGGGVNGRPPAKLTLGDFLNSGWDSTMISGGKLKA